MNELLLVLCKIIFYTIYYTHIFRFVNHKSAKTKKRAASLNRRPLMVPGYTTVLCAPGT